MIEIINKLIEIEKTTSLERGRYKLFGLFLREDSFDKWDIVVAADWLTVNTKEALRYLSEKITASLTKEELLLISHIAILPPEDQIPKLTRGINIEHGALKMSDFNFFDRHIKKAYLITLQVNQAA